MVHIVNLKDSAVEGSAIQLQEKLQINQASEREIVFLRIQKTGSTAASFWLTGECDRAIPGCNQLKRPHKPWQAVWHWDSFTIDKLYEDNPNHLEFVTLRNPLDRVLSEYYMCVMAKERRMCFQQQWGYAKHLPVSKLLSKGCSIEAFFHHERHPAHNRQTRMLSSYLRSSKEEPVPVEWLKNLPKSWASRKQRLLKASPSIVEFESSDYPSDLDANDLDAAKKRIDNSFGLGIKEFLPETFKLWCAQLSLQGCAEQSPKERHNAPVNAEISEEMKKLIEQHNGLDIKLYEYAKSIFLERLKQYDITHSETRIEQRDYGESRSVILFTVKIIDDNSIFVLKKLAGDLRSKPCMNQFKIVVLVDGKWPDKYFENKVQILNHDEIYVEVLNRDDLNAVYGPRVYKIFAQPYNSPDKIGSIVWANRNPQYSAYWLMENDVGISGNWCSFFQEYLGQEYPDMIFPRKTKMPDSWMWWAARKGCDKYPCTDKSNRLMIFWPLARFSQNAMKLLHDSLNEQVVAMSEAIVGTICQIHPNCTMGVFKKDWVDSRGKMEGGPFRVNRKQMHMSMSWPNMLYHPVEFVEDFKFKSSNQETNSFESYLESLNLKIDMGKPHRCSSSGNKHMCHSAGSCFWNNDQEYHCLPTVFIGSGLPDYDTNKVTMALAKEGLAYTKPAIDIRCIHGQLESFTIKVECPVEYPDIRSHWNQYLKSWSSGLNADIYGDNFVSIVPQDVQNLIPGGKYVFVLGNPSEFCFKIWQRECGVRCSKSDFEHQLHEILLGKSNTVSVILDQMRYGTYLSKWIHSSPTDDILVILVGMSHDPYHTAATIMQFINSSSIDRRLEVGHSVRSSIIETYLENDFQLLRKALKKLLVVGVDWTKISDSIATPSNSIINSCPALSNSTWLRHLVESHGKLKNITSITQRLKTTECKDYYQSCVETPSKKDAFDPETFVYLPIGAPKKKKSIERMITLEDTFLNLHKANGTSQKDSWDIPLYLRTISRAVKCMMNESGSVYVPIWKAGSSSVSMFLSKGWRGPHALPPSLWKTFDPFTPPCSVLNNQSTMVLRLNHPDKSCIEFGTSLIQSSTSMAFTVVRDPIARFLSGYQPHKRWTNAHICQHHVCESTMAELRSHSAMLLNYFPTSLAVRPNKFERKIPHWLTQSYFLGATDGAGNPIQFQAVFKLEDGNIFENISSLLTYVSHSRIINRGGSTEIKKWFLEDVANDIQIICNLCRIYAQDFVCLGYPLPKICQGEQCS